MLRGNFGAPVHGRTLVVVCSVQASSARLGVCQLSYLILVSGPVNQRGGPIAIVG